VLRRCCRHACELGFVGEGDVVAIWGAGPVGMLAAHLSQVLPTLSSFRLSTLLRGPGPSLA